jgi:putative tryptophan/tyrosine transport system substrate-binding protein
VIGRRKFITALGGAAVTWPLRSRAKGIRRIGVLIVEDNSANRTNLAALLGGLERTGWSEGRNARIDVRFAEPEQVRACAQELISLQPDVVVAFTTPAAIALQRQSRTIPIVFIGVADPIGAGLVASLARPDGNLTGFLSYQDTITGKWLAMLKEVAPHLERAALLANPKTSPYDYFMRAARLVAPSLAIEIVSSPIESAVDIEEAIASLTRMTNCGLVITPDTTTATHRALIIALVTQHRLPAVYFNRYWVSAGGLMSYGIDFPAHFLQAATYVDRILRGTMPSELPVQTPIKYETVLNLKTAKALGLNVPAGLLVATDEVIE